MTDKAEFVCECDYSDQLHMWYTVLTAPRELVVRCRDCIHASPYNDEWLDCLHFSEWDYYADVPGHCPVKPDFFCANGEMEEDE